MYDASGRLFGKPRTTSTTASVPGLWTMQQQIEAKRADLWPIAPVPGDPFPAAYRSLIDNFASTKYYVDALKGSDLSAGTSRETSLATLDKAIEIAPGGSMIVVYPGSYHNPNTYTSMYDSYYSSVIIDRNKSLQIVCAPGQVMLTGTDLGRRDFGHYTFLNVNSKIYGAIIYRNNGGRTANFSTAISRSGQGALYNCVFREVGTNGYFSLHYANGYVTFSNCLVIGGSWTGNYNGTGAFLYSASNNASVSAASSNIGNGLGKAINLDWSVDSISYGVYSGTYAWNFSTLTYS